MARRWLPWCLLAAACGSAPRWQLHDPGRPTAEQQARLAAAEREYRAGKDLDALRPALAADPVTAWWWTRMVVRDLVFVREGRVTAAEKLDAPAAEVPDLVASGRAPQPGDSDLLLQATAGRKEPLEQRAMREIDAMGTAAVPCIVDDLARHPQSFVRSIGVELLGRLGEHALPLVLEDLARSPDPVHRRTGAQAIAAMPPDATTEAHLTTLAGDAHQAVRAAAYGGLPPASADAGSLLRKALEADPDAFGRRAAARALGSHRQPSSAHSLVAYLQRCQAERDAEGAEAAQEALQELSRTRGPRSAAAWRTWATSLPPLMP
jgi:hypothetical protein